MLHVLTYLLNHFTFHLTDNKNKKTWFTCHVEAVFIFCTLILVAFQKLYASIRSEPFKIPEDDGNDLTLTFFNPDREGWLLKMGETAPRLTCA